MAVFVVLENSSFVKSGREQTKLSFSTPSTFLIPLHVLTKLFMYSYVHTSGSVVLGAQDVHLGTHFFSFYAFK